MSRKRILFTSPVLEYPPADGPALRICNSIKALNSTADLFVVSRNYKFLMGGERAELFYKNHCQLFSYAPSARKMVLNCVLRLASHFKKLKWNWLFSKILAIVYKFSPRISRDVDYLVNYVNVNRIDIVWFGFGNISFELMKGVRAKLPHVKLVCDTDAVWSRFILRELDVITDLDARKKIEKEGYAKKLEEVEWQEFVNVTTAVSEVDACYYRDISKLPDKIKIFSNVIDIEAYLQKPKHARGLITPNIYLAGSFWPGCPMEHASRWFVEKVFPILLDVNPNLHFYIVGKNSDSILADIRYPNITVTGKVDSVLPYLCYAAVAVVPLFFESGTRFKILEAGAVGVPIVSTTLGAEGLPVRHGEHLLIADTPEDFAIAINQIITSPHLSKKLAHNCKKLILEKFSVQSLASEAQQIIVYLNNKY